MAIDLFIAGVCIGSVIRGAGSVFAYAADGTALGQYATTDAAAVALAARAGPKAEAA